MVLPHHRLCRRAAALRRHRLARTCPRHADELDRPIGRRRALVRGRRAPRRAHQVLHHAAGHDLRCDLHGARARNMAEIERTSTEREKTGVETGAFARNEFSGERIPIWVADYVLSTYGTGAIMAVPAHDERDFE